MGDEECCSRAEREKKKKKKKTSVDETPKDHPVEDKAAVPKNSP